MQTAMEHELYPRTLLRTAKQNAWKSNTIGKDNKLNEAKRCGWFNETAWQTGFGELQIAGQLNERLKD